MPNIELKTSPNILLVTASEKNDLIIVSGHANLEAFVPDDP